MNEEERTFCQDLLKDVVTVQARYKELCDEVDTLEQTFRRRFGGAENVGNPELAHRITFWWNKLDEKLNRKENEL